MNLHTTQAPASGVVLPIPTQPHSILTELENHQTVMTVNEVALLLRLSKFTIYRMAEKNQIPSMLIGGSRRFNPMSLAFWLRKKDPMLAKASKAA